MNNTTKMQVDQILKNKWYRNSQTLGEGGWSKIHASGIDWKKYVLYAESSENGLFLEIETITAGDDKTALSAFASLYHLHMFDYWEIQERITEYRLIEVKKEE